MITKQKTRYEGALNFPEGTQGAYAIRHQHRPAQHRFSTASARTALLAGHENKHVTFDHETRWHELSGPTGVWMTDLPIEQAQHDRLLAPVLHGRVLIGGLGLGYAATVLAQRPGVREVVVVERSPEVIELVAQHLAPQVKRKMTVVNSCLFEFLSSLKRMQLAAFNWAFYDTWQHDGEATFFKVVVPLHLASQGRIKHEPICWNEDVMRGQLFFSLHSRWSFAQQKAQQHLHPGFTLEDLCTPIGNLWRDWSVPFFRWVRRVGPSAKEVQVHAGLYAQQYGLRGFWELWKHCTTEEGAYVYTEGTTQEDN